MRIFVWKNLTKSLIFWCRFWTWIWGFLSDLCAYIIWKKASYLGATICTGIWGFLLQKNLKKASYSGADTCTGIWGFLWDLFFRKFEKKPHIPVHESAPEYEAFCCKKCEKKPHIPVQTPAPEYEAFFQIMIFIGKALRVHIE